MACRHSGRRSALEHAELESATDELAPDADDARHNPWTLSDFIAQWMHADNRLSVGAGVTEVILVQIRSGGV
ncbi:MAG: hypothetical protein OXE87_04180 [Chloroflexi bacterium]|nr:hypothetical protein [Chloroflexota bacterium]